MSIPTVLFINYDILTAPGTADTTTVLLSIGAN